MRQNRLTQTLLAPLGSLYGAIVQTRTNFYEKGWLHTEDLGLPVVSVGNVTIGGTGKTPLVQVVARVLAENRHRVCVLTRGYKRRNPHYRVLVSDGLQIQATAETGGDEAFEMAKKLLGTAAIIADKNRVDAGIWAKENLGATAFVLDDGFQHLRLKRDLDVVTIDATNPFGNRKTLPAGILREPLSSLKRADLIVITRSDLNEEISNLKSDIQKYNPSCPILLARNEIKKLKLLAEFLNSEKNQNSVNRLYKSVIQNPTSEMKLAVFCAIGNPSAFYRDLEKLNLKIVTSVSFRDHFGYQHQDIEIIEQKAKDAGANALVTTAKDAGKLEKIKFELPCLVAEAQTVFDDAEPLVKLLKKL